MGYAKRTSGGMTKDDIIMKNINGKTYFVSKKIGDRMRSKIKTQGSIRKKTNNNCNYYNYQEFIKNFRIQLDTQH